MASDFNNRQILVTGGAGYIGSHTVVQLLEAGAQVVVLDNLCNSKREVINRIETITGRRPEFVVGDIRDRALLRSVFNNHRIDSVIHFAGLKAVGESVQKPLEYYDNNVAGSLVLFEEMGRSGVKNLVFSSSATVYVEPGVFQSTEDLPSRPTNVCGHAKLMVEEILRDLHRADFIWRIAILRCGRAAGAHESGLIGEDMGGTEKSLMYFMAQEADDRKANHMVGKTWSGEDHRAIHEYIHVEDLALGHLLALKALKKIQEPLTANLNICHLLKTGEKHKELESNFKPMSYEAEPRSTSILPVGNAESSQAKELLGWEARYDIDRIYRDAKRWQSLNPVGLITNSCSTQRFIY